MNTFISGFIVLLAFSPLFVGCASSHEAPPERITSECGSIDDTESFMNPEDQFLLWNESVPDAIQFCFLRSSGMNIPESMGEACAEYIAGSVSCDDAHSRWELCMGCAEEWENNL